MKNAQWAGTDLVVFFLVMACAAMACNRSTPTVSVVADENIERQIDDEPVVEVVEVEAAKPQVAVDSDPLEYWVVLSSNHDDGSYEDDSTLRYGGFRYDGDLIVFVNGTPVKIRKTGGEAWRINEFMEDGENTVTFEGDATRPLFAKIVTLYRSEFKPPEYKFRDTIAKTRFTLDEKEKAQLRFNARVATPLPYELLADDENSRKQQIKELQEICNKIADSLKKHDYDGFFRLTGQDRYGITKFGTTQKEVDACMAAMRGYTEDKDMTLLTDLSEVKFVVGRRGILVYKGYRYNGDAYLLEMEKELAPKEFLAPTAPPQIFVKRDGNWTVP